MLLLDEFERYIEENKLFNHDDRILLTVSGGVDSMVMMALTAAAGYKFGVAHCNFQLRGEESDGDEKLVEQEARHYGAEFYNKRFDTVGEMERTGESMEMAARRLRYQWFRELCDEHGYT
ncbi:MAG: ATP-binding protein, partial [Alistipes sp.]|nr:ATP-binding protein [Alistipes sp.]